MSTKSKLTPRQLAGVKKRRETYDAWAKQRAAYIAKLLPLVEAAKERLKLTDAEIARRAGLVQPFMHGLRRGQRVTQGAVQALAGVLGFDPPAGVEVLRAGADGRWNGEMRRALAAAREQVAENAPEGLNETASKATAALLMLNQLGVVLADELPELLTRAVKLKNARPQEP